MNGLLSWNETPNEVPETLTPRLIAEQLLIALRMISGNGDETYGPTCADETHRAYRTALTWIGDIPANRIHVVDELTAEHGVDLATALVAVYTETAHELAPATMPAGKTGEKDGVPVTRKPEHAGYDELGDWNSPGEDYLLYVDGKRIGCTYWCGSSSVPDGQRWASWGCAGLKLGLRTREDAEQAQVDAYTGPPGLCPDCEDDVPMVHAAGGYSVCPACQYLTRPNGRTVRS
jgi:hypothetical protein